MTKIEHNKKWMPIMYVNYFGLLQQIAVSHGYALCVHGSVVRDFDLIFVPFDVIVSPHEKVLKDIKQKIGNDKSTKEIFDKVGHEPHGRTCYTIECGGGGYFDISFTPSMQEAIEQINNDNFRKIEMQQLLSKSK